MFDSSDLCNAKLYNANLTKANLSYTDMSFAKGNYAIFDNADLTGSIIISSDFSCCKFNHAILYSSNLYNTNFENSHFTDIDIYERHGFRFKTNIATFDFTTNKFPLLFCEKTNFKNAVFSNMKIIQYIKKQGGLNLPNSSTNS